jgi:hypothetical protein
VKGARIVFRSIMALSSATSGLGLLLLSGGAVVFGTGDCAVINEVVHALEVEARKVARRLNGSELRLLLFDIELHEDVAFGDRSAGLKRDARNDTRKIRADRDALNRCGSAYRVQCCGPGFIASDDGCHGFGRLLVRGGLGHGFLNLLELYEAESADRGECDDQHQNHSFNHLCSSPLLLRRTTEAEIDICAG